MRLSCTVSILFALSGLGVCEDELVNIGSGVYDESVDAAPAIEERAVGTPQTPGMSAALTLLGRKLLGQDEDSAEAEVLAPRAVVCPAGQQVCDDSCIPSGATCCRFGNNAFCGALEYCTNNNLCCPDGKKCPGPGICKPGHVRCGAGCIPKGKTCCGSWYCGHGDKCTSTGCSSDKTCPPPPPAITRTVTVTAPCTTVRPPTTSARPPTTSARPPTTSARPPTTSARPPTTSARPPTTSARPPTTSVRPPTTSARPPTTSARPPTTSARPPTTSVRPPTTTLRPPTTTSSRPATTTTSARPSGPVTVNGAPSSGAGGASILALALGLVAAAQMLL